MHGKNDAGTDIFEKLQKLDFSSQSKGHKEKLWRELSGQSKARQLSDDELDLIAAAGGQTTPKEPDKTE